MKNKIFNLFMALSLLGLVSSIGALSFAEGTQKQDGVVLDLKDMDESFVYSDGDTKVVMGTELTVDEDEVLEELVVVAGRVEVFGEVEELTVLGGRVILGPTAKVTKELKVIGGSLEQDPEAIVFGKQTTVDLPTTSHQWDLVLEEVLFDRFDRFFDENPWTSWLFRLFKILCIYLMAKMVMAIAPLFTERSKNQFIESSLVSGGWGVVSVFLFLPLVLMLVLSVIGIALLPLQVSLYVLFLIIGYSTAAQACSELVGSKFNLGKGSLLLGLIGFELILLVPYIGWLSIAVASFLGFGAVSAAFYGQILKRFSGGPV